MIDCITCTCIGSNSSRAKTWCMAILLLRHGKFGLFVHQGIELQTDVRTFKYKLIWRCIKWTCNNDSNRCIFCLDSNFENIVLYRVTPPKVLSQIVLRRQDQVHCFLKQFPRSQYTLLFQGHQFDESWIWSSFFERNCLENRLQTVKSGAVGVPKRIRN